MNFEHMKIPADVGHILEKLNRGRYEAYLVGGCVRDCVLGKAPKDWDIATNARPGAVKELFDRTVDTGIRHGTVTVMLNDGSYEVTTYRMDGRYEDGRHPMQVYFTSRIHEDLARRDFTVNAMAYHPDHGLVDPFKGMQDIGEGVIRAVGEADERFTEDALRMLRAVRFCAQLGFTIEPATLQAIRDHAELIRQISGERVRDELDKLLASQYAGKIMLLRETGLLGHILPELDSCFGVLQDNPYHICDVGEHTVKALEQVENQRTLRWAVLLHDIGKPLVKSRDKKGIGHFYGHAAVSVQLARRALKRLKFDNRTMESILSLIEHHDRKIAPDEGSVRKAAREVGDDLFPGLLSVMEADKKAQNPVFLQDRLEELENIRRLYLKLKEEGCCLSLKDLAVNGSDLIGQGFSEGEELGRALDKLLELVLENPELNTKEKLLEIARGIMD